MNFYNRIKYFYKCVTCPPKTSLMPLSVNIEINNICNLSCQMCNRKLLKGKDRIMSFDEFKKVYAQIKSPFVALHGYGEPLLNNNLAEMLAYLKDNGAKASITSNFTAIEEEMMQKLILSDVGLIKISIDSHVPATYRKIRGADKLKKVIDNILLFEEKKKILRKNMPTLRISYTIQPCNYKEIPDFIDFVKNILRQDIIFFQLLLFKDSLLADVDLGVIDKAGFLKALVESERIARKLAVCTNLGTLISEFNNTWAHYDTKAKKTGKYTRCLKPWLTTFIDANGNVKPCDILGLSDVIMGNVFEQPFSQIWNSPRYTEFRREISYNKRPNNVCRECMPLTLAGLVRYTAFTPNYLKE